MNLRPGIDTDSGAIQGLLQDCHLPVSDLEGATVDFIVAMQGETLVGVVALERFELPGLLRSLAVRKNLRGCGLGEKLVSAMEAHAVGSGISQLVLLTETAAPFFNRRHYTAIERAHAPFAVQQSAEFRSLCPASATCMIKPLVQHPTQP